MDSTMRADVPQPAVTRGCGHSSGVICALERGHDGDHVDQFNHLHWPNRQRRMPGMGEVCSSDLEGMEKVLRAVLASAWPHPVEHPTMFKAWADAEQFLKKLEEKRE